jgi:hypothetical protein
MDKWTNGQMDKWTNGQMDKWTTAKRIQSVLLLKEKKFFD